MADKRHEYAVVASSFGAQINVGRINAKGDAFTSKQERTDMVLAAVAQYVERNFDGGMEATFPGLNLRLVVKVEPLEDKEDEEVESDG